MSGFGERVRHYRERAELTQEQLAVRIGWASSTIQNIESGRSSPSITRADALARALGVTIFELLGALPKVEAGQGNGSLAEANVFVVTEDSPFCKVSWSPLVDVCCDAA